MTNMTKPLEVVLKRDSRGRVRTPADRRERLLDEFERSGLSGAKFAALAGIKYQTFAAWSLRRRQQPVSSKAPAKTSDSVRWLEAVVTEAQAAPKCDGAGLKVHLAAGGWMEVTVLDQVPLAAELLRALAKPALPC